jgi:hypothetical protein
MAIKITILINPSATIPTYCFFFNFQLELDEINLVTEGRYVHIEQDVTTDLLHVVILLCIMKIPVFYEQNLTFDFILPGFEVMTVDNRE